MTGLLSPVRYALAAGVLLAAEPALAQTLPAPPPPPTSGVIRPPANVDPGMKVAPPQNVRLPTPVVHPPAPKDTVVVPR